MNSYRNKFASKRAALLGTDEPVSEIATKTIPPVPVPSVTTLHATESKSSAPKVDKTSIGEKLKKKTLVSANRNRGKSVTISVCFLNIFLSIT